MIKVVKTPTGRMLDITTEALRFSTKTITTINSELEKKQTPYRLVEIDSRKKGAGDKKAWLVKALVLQQNGSYLLM